MVAATEKSDPNWREQNSAVEKVAVLFPNQGDGQTGTHINISGAGVCRYAPNRNNAIKFIEFLVSDRAQDQFAEANFEYPLRETSNPSKLSYLWSTFNRDTLPVEELGKHNKIALKIMQAAGWQ